MSIVQQIVVGWLLLGLIGTILSKSRKIFLPPKKVNLDDFPEHQRDLMEASQEMLKDNPFLEFCIELFMGLLYVGQWNFAMVFVWLYRVIVNCIQWLWWHIKIPFNIYSVNKRVERMRKGIHRVNPSFTEQQLEDRVMEISTRWNNIYRKVN